MTQIRTELLRAIRGKRSQEQLNRKLKFSFNQIYRWESGHTRILWPDLVRLCHHCKIDLPTALKKALNYHDDPKKSDRLLRHLMAGKKISDFSAKTGISRFVLSDWLNGKSNPPLDAILEILKHEQLLLHFVGELVSIDQVPSLKKEYKLLLLENELYASKPHLTIGTLLFELEEYLKKPRHENGFIARKMGITQEEEELLISLLSKNNVIQFKNGKYEMPPRAFYLLRSVADKVALYWTQRGVTSMERNYDSPDDLYKYRIFSYSDESYAKIKKTCSDFLHEISQIIMDDQLPKTGIASLNLNVFDVLNNR